MTDPAHSLMQQPRACSRMHSDIQQSYAFQVSPSISLSQCFSGFFFKNLLLEGGVEGYLRNLLSRFEQFSEVTDLYISAASALSFVSQGSFASLEVAFCFREGSEAVDRLSFEPLLALVGLSNKEITRYEIEHETGYRFRRVNTKDEKYCLIEIPFSPTALTIKLVESCKSPTNIEQCRIELDPKSFQAKIEVEQHQRMCAILARRYFSVDEALARRQHEGLYYYCELLTQGFFPESIFTAEKAYCDALADIDGLSGYLKQFGSPVQKCFLRNLERIIYCSDHPLQERFLAVIHEELARLTEVTPIGTPSYSTPMLFPLAAPFDPKRYFSSLIAILKRWPYDSNKLLRDQEIQLMRAGQPALLKGGSLFKGLWASGDRTWKEAGLKCATEKELLEVLEEAALDPALFQLVLQTLRPLTLLKLIAKERIPQAGYEQACALVKTSASYQEFLNASAEFRSLEQEEKMRLLCHFNGYAAVAFFMERVESFDLKKFVRELAKEKREEGFLQELDVLLRFYGFDKLPALTLVELYGRRRAYLEKLDEVKANIDEGMKQYERSDEAFLEAAIAPHPRRELEITLFAQKWENSAVLRYARYLLEGLSPNAPFYIEWQFTKRLPDETAFKEFIEEFSEGKRKGFLINLQRILVRCSLEETPLACTVARELQLMEAVKAEGALFFAVPISGAAAEGVLEPLPHSSLHCRFVTNDLRLQGVASLFTLFVQQGMFQEALAFATAEEAEQFFLEHSKDHELAILALRKMGRARAQALFDELWEAGKDSVCRELFFYLPAKKLELAALEERWSQLNERQLLPKELSLWISTLTEAARKDKSKAAQEFVMKIALEDPLLEESKAIKLFNQLLQGKKHAQAAVLLQRFPKAVITSTKLSKTIDKITPLFSHLKQEDAILAALLEKASSLGAKDRGGSWLALSRLLETTLSEQSKERILLCLTAAHETGRFNAQWCYEIACQIMSPDLKVENERFCRTLSALFVRISKSMKRSDLLRLLDGLKAFFWFNWAFLPADFAEELLCNFQERKINHKELEKLLVAALMPVHEELKEEAPSASAQRCAEELLGVMRALSTKLNIKDQLFHDMILYRMEFILLLKKPALWKDDFEQILLFTDANSDQTKIISLISTATHSYLTCRLGECSNDIDFTDLTDLFCRAITAQSFLYSSTTHFFGELMQAVLEKSPSQGSLPKQIFQRVRAVIKAAYLNSHMQIILFDLSAYYYLKDNPAAKFALNCASSLAFEYWIKPIEGELSKEQITILIQLMRALSAAYTSKKWREEKALKLALFFFQRLYVNVNLSLLPNPIPAEYPIDLIEDPSRLLNRVSGEEEVEMALLKERRGGVLAFLDDLINLCCGTDLVAAGTEIKCNYLCSYSYTGIEVVAHSQAKRVPSSIPEAQTALMKEVQKSESSPAIVIELFEAFAAACVVHSSKGDQQIWRRVKIVYEMIKNEMWDRLSDDLKAKLALIDLAAQAAFCMDYKGLFATQEHCLEGPLKDLPAEYRAKGPLAGALIYLLTIFHKDTIEGGYFPYTTPDLIFELFLRPTNLSIPKQALVNMRNGSEMFAKARKFLEIPNGVDDRGGRTAAIEELSSGEVGRRLLPPPLLSLFEGRQDPSDLLRQFQEHARDLIACHQKHAGLLDFHCLTWTYQILVRFLKDEFPDAPEREGLALTTLAAHAALSRNSHAEIVGISYSILGPFSDLSLDTRLDHPIVGSALSLFLSAALKRPSDEMFEQVVSYLLKELIFMKSNISEHTLLSREDNGSAAFATALSYLRKRPERVLYNHNATVRLLLESLCEEEEDRSALSKMMTEVLRNSLSIIKERSFDELEETYRIIRDLFPGTLFPDNIAAE